MFKDVHAFSGFSVTDLDEAVTFYGETLGLDVEKSEMGVQLKIAGGNPIFVYDKKDHVPATFTILNFPVEDIDEAVDGLVNKNVEMIRYDNMPFQQDEKGIARGRAANMGPDIAWFKDPAGNVLAVLQN